MIAPTDGKNKHRQGLDWQSCSERSRAATHLLALQAQADQLLVDLRLLHRRTSPTLSHVYQFRSFAASAESFRSCKVVVQHGVGHGQQL